MPDRRAGPERFLTTVVMTDIVGSTQHAAELGDSAWRDLLQQHHALIRTELRRNGGREMDTAGDGFFAVFDAPAAAVACVLAMAEGVSRLGLDIRAGIHVGEVQQMGGKVTGIAVVIASRIMANAGAGEVLVSSTVRDLAAGSGLTFDDRGRRPLKGVPDEWHVYAVHRAEKIAVESGGPAAHKRRAAAVRRARARPIWQRRPRLAAGVSLGLAFVVVTSGLLIWKPWQPAALGGVAEGSIGIIDPDRDEVIGEIPVGARPGGIALSEGYAWVTNTGADTVSQIDLATRAAVNRIPVGREPTGIAVAQGSVWVTNSGERSVSRINVATGRVVDTIDVGNGPTAIAAVGSMLWVANATDSTVVSIDARTGELAIDARTGEVALPTGVAARPVALGADANDVWVASEDGAAVSHLDPVTGRTLGVPILLAMRPTAIALDPDSVWVASADGTLTRIDRDTNRVTATDVGGELGALVITDDVVWLGDRKGFVHRLSKADPSSTRERIAIVSSVGALAVVGEDIWVAAQASLASHRGGTLRIVEPFRYETDPLSNYESNAALLEADGLVGYRRVGGSAGSVLLPDLAVAIPSPTNAGLTYTFQLRPNLVYSTGEPVRTADFRRAVERSFQVVGPQETVVGYRYFLSILGTKACAIDPPTPTHEPDTPVDRCDLSSGIVTDETTNTVTFNLYEPDPDFVYKLAVPAAYPVPKGISMHQLVEGMFPGTGPYTVNAVTETEVRLGRNPLFQVWDAAVRPDGYPDEIVFTTIDCPKDEEEEEEESCAEIVDATRISMVENGEADYTSYRIATVTPSPELFAGLQARYGGQWHVALAGVTRSVVMNTEIPPFDNLDARRAVNFAIDRARVADFYGGQPLVSITCQILPPGWLGYQPYCPYTLDPDQGGRWWAPDLEQAQRLVARSGTAGAKVVVGPAFGIRIDLRDYLGSLLEKLGYEVSIDRDIDPDHVIQAIDEGKVQIAPFGWVADYLAPSNFFRMFTCAGTFQPINYCDPEFDRAFDHALELQTTDPSTAGQAWTAVDQLAVDLGLWAPLYNGGGDFVSARAGNYQFSPTSVVLFDQMWVQ
jgi:peptide/nickel transport system substrate-binding protein